MTGADIERRDGKKTGAEQQQGEIEHGRSLVKHDERMRALAVYFRAGTSREKIRISYTGSGGAAGPAGAKRKGTKSGKPIGRPKLDMKREAALREALAAGVGILKAAKTVGVGTGTVSRIDAEMRG